MADRRVTFLISANTKNFTKGIRSAQRTFRKFGRKLQRTGRTLSRSVSAPLALAGGAAIKMAGDFEQSFADIEKTVDGTPQQFAQLSSEIRQMARTIPTSVNELNRMAGVAGQLGIEAENITAFTKTIAMLGDATDIAGEQAALSLSRFMNIMGTATEDIDRLGATLVGLGNNFAAMESEIVEISSSLAPLGNSIGLTEQQVLAFGTTIAASGGKAQAASTAFQKMGNTMKTAVLEGNEDLQVFANTAGMTASEFQEAFQKDAAQALQAFMGGLQRVQKEGGSMESILDDVGLAQQRLVREFGKVLGNLDQLDSALGQANSEWDRNTALTEEAQKRYSTLNSRLSILWNRVYDVGIQIGNALIPVVNKLISATESITEWFGKLSDETIAMGAIVAGVIGAGGPILVAAGVLMGAMSALLAPVSLTTAAIAGLFTGVVVSGQWMVDNYDKILTYFEGLWVAAKQTALISLRGIISGIKKFVNFATMLAPPELLTGIFGVDLSEMAFDFVGVNDLLEGLNDDIESAGKEARALTAQYYGSAFTSITESAGNALENAKTAVINGLKGILNSSQVQSLLSEIDAMFAGADGGGVATVSQDEEVKEPAGKMGEMTNPLEGMAGKFQSDISKMIAGTKKFKNISEAALGATESAWDRFKEAWKQAGDNAQLQGQAVTAAFQAMADEGISSLGDLAKATVNTARQIISAEIAKGVAAAVRGALTNVPFPFNIAAAAGAGAAASGLFNSVVPKLEDGGIIPPGFPNDTYPAMLSSGETVIPSPKPLGAGMGGTIENKLYVDGRQIEIALEDRKYNRNR